MIQINKVYSIVAYAMAIVLTSPYVFGYQFPHGSQPQFENKCQLINMRSLHLATRMDDTFTNSVNRNGTYTF